LKNVIDGKIQRGVTPDVAEAHILSLDEARDFGIESTLLKPSLSGEAIKPYYSAISDQVLIYTDNEIDIDEYPMGREYLEKFREKVTCKEVREGKHPWWRLHRPRDPEIFTCPKFIGVTTSKRIELVFDARGNLYVTDAMYIFKIAPSVPWQFVLGVMQSIAFLFFYRVSNQGEGRVIPQVKAVKLNDIPFPAFDALNENHLQILSEVEAQISLTREWVGSTGDRKARIHAQILSRRDKLDDLVFGAFSFTDSQKAAAKEKVL